MHYAGGSVALLIAETYLLICCIYKYVFGSTGIYM